MSGKTEKMELIQEFIDAMHEGVVVLEEEFILHANEAFLEMLGFELDDVLDLPFDDLVDPLSLKHDLPMIESMIDGVRETRFNTRLRSKRGSAVHVEIKPKIIDIDDGSVVIAAVKDVSRQIQLQEAVTELENRFALLYDLSPIAYLTLNRTGMIEQVNQAAEDLLGCPADEIIGKHMSLFLPEPDSGCDPSGDIVREALQGKAITGIEMEMLRKDNRIIWVNVSSRALASNTERPNEIGLMAFDITRRRAAELKLREESKRANLYISVMTDDLNAIAQNALFSIEHLKASGISETEGDALRDISWNIRRAARMITNMEVLIRLNTSPPEKGRTDIYSHIKKAAREADRDFDWKKLELKTDIKASSFLVQAHAYLWNVFFQIIHNSMKYDQKDHVVVDVSAKLVDSGRQVRIEISDYGPGIPDGLKSAIFKKLHDDSERIASDGLGLTVVHHYISDLRGQVWAEDRVDGDPSKGSRIVILIPVWLEELDIPTISFYKSEHCIFCGPVLESLTVILDEMGISRSALDVIDIDDPASGVSDTDLPALPTIQMGHEELAGYVSEEDLRASVMKLMMES